MDALAIIDLHTRRNAKALQLGYIDAAKHQQRQTELEELQNYIAELEQTIAIQNRQLLQVEAIKQALQQQKEQHAALWQLLQPNCVLPCNMHQVTAQNVNQFHHYHPSGTVGEFEQFIAERDTIALLIDAGADLTTIPNINSYFTLFKVAG